jgi:hypothetical protein
MPNSPARALCGALASAERAPSRRLVLVLPALALICALARSGAAEAIALPSAGNFFIVRLAGIGPTEQVNRMHGFDLSLTTVDGRAAGGAAIRLTGLRRYTQSPLPTSPRVSPGPGEGSYRIEGLRFHMPGEWRLVFEIDFEQISDHAAIEIVVK